MFANKKRAGNDLRYLSVQDRPRARLAKIFSILNLLAGLVYLIWVWRNLNFSSPVMSFMFITAEGFMLFLFFTASINVWQLRFKPEKGLPPQTPMSVDVFVTTAGEPFKVIKTTMEAARRLHWDWELNLYLLDDGGSEELESFAHELGFHYLSRVKMGVEKKNSKAGNLNFGMSHSSGTLILVLDADQIVEPDALNKIAGYFKFDDLAFVQTQQNFFLPTADPYYNSDHVFYGTMQKAFDSNNNVISCGSGVLYRRAALESIGGFAEWNLVEDLTTSYELHSHGWRSFYYCHPITKGLAPSNLKGVYHQRSQWALDTFRIFLWDNPLFKKGLDLKSRMNYLAIPVAYLASAFFFPALFLIPLWTYATGGFVLSGDMWEFLGLRIIYFVFMSLSMRFMFRGNFPGKQFMLLLGLFPVYMMAFFRAFIYPKGRKPQYSITNAAASNINNISLVLILPQALLFLAHIVGPFYAMWNNHVPGKYIFVNSLVSALCIWLLWQLMMAALSKPVFSDEEDPENVYI